MMKKYELIIDEFGMEMLKATSQDDKELWIPCNEANSDYQAYLEYLTTEGSN